MTHYSCAYDKGHFEVHGVNSLSLPRILEGRRNRDTFHWFLDNIASAVVSSRVVEQVKSMKTPSEWLTRSLEAFSLVCVENFFEMARKQVMNKDSRRNYQALYTADGRGKQKNQGWSQEGIRRYNDLCKQVRLDRERFPIEDEIYFNKKQQERQAMEMEKLKRVKDRTDTRERGLQAAENDFSSSDEE
jgi:hypothetical protein